MPDFVLAGRVGRLDRIMRRVYDTFGRLHDPALRIALPLIDGVSEAEGRQRILDRIPPGALVAPANRPLRVLDVSFGTGGELLGLARICPPSSQLFGVDLSCTMARLGARALRDANVDAELCLGDAHHLPYTDDQFDLVVHVGGINAFSDKARALTEMVRVARPGASLLVVDERLDRASRPSIATRLLFRAVTWWDRTQEAPVGDLPPEAEDVEVEQLLSFYYVMTFTKSRRPAP